jgi:hypothetical protein
LDKLERFFINFVGFWNRASAIVVIIGDSANRVERMAVKGRSHHRRWTTAAVITAMMASGNAAWAGVTASPSLDLTAQGSALDSVAIAPDPPSLLAQPEALPAPLAYTVCSESLTWTRPTVEEQSRHLNADPRYRHGVPGELAQAWVRSFWEKDVISFTTYGLSARQEPIYFSGLWSLLEQQPVWEQCYDADRISQINSGQLAELWLIGHRVRSVQWVDNRYVVTVEPTAQGVQFVQFPRRETLTTLPLQVMTEDQVPLDVVSADQIAPSL